MKRILLPAALVLAMTGAFAFAQQADQAPTPQQQHHREHHARDPHKAALMLGKKLNLTPDQTAKVEPILADRQQKIAALRSNESLDPKVRHEQMHAIQKDTFQQLSGVLTPEQVEQMKSMRHGRHGQHNEHPAA